MQSKVRKHSFLIGVFVLTTVVIAGCTSTTTTTTTSQTTTSPTPEVSVVTPTEVDTGAEADTGADFTTPQAIFFDDSTLLSDISLVDCTLSGGTESTCYSFTTQLSVTDDDIGPRCPRSIEDSADAGGIWLDSGEVYDVDGAFISQLSTFYNDDARQLYDETTGLINVTDTQEACEGAAKPNVEEQYQNHCVECQLSYMEELPVTTYVIPAEPVVASTTQANNAGPFGVAFNGVRFDAPAPVDAILSAYTIAAFDDCGGHINPTVGYHYHASTGCAPAVEVAEDHTKLIGFALDGFPMYEHDESLDDLDACGGHESAELGYHYHVASAGANQFLGCFSGEYGCSNDGESSECDASASANSRPGGGPGGPR